MADNVRSLIRGLEILRYVNGAGSAKPAQIARALSIPRPTVYRLIHTLEEAGYILFSASDSRVRVSPLASGLGDNSALRSQICKAAAPLLIRFTDTHAWPIDLTVYRDLRMIVEETTHWRSPVSLDTNMAGNNLPILRTSAGRAYLAFAEEQERAIILNLLRQLDAPEDQPFLQEDWITAQIAQTRQQGFATRGPRTFRAETSSLAVPILLNGRIAACLSIIWITSALTMKQAQTNYAEPMMALAREIAAATAQISSDG